MTNHANCDHDNTKAARAACRRAQAKAVAATDTAELKVRREWDKVAAELEARNAARDAAYHCELCGGLTGPPNEYNQSYSQCCNEPIHDGDDHSRCHHN